MIHRNIWMGYLSKLEGPNTMLGVTGGTVTANVISKPRRSLVHSLKRGQGSSATLDLDKSSRKTSTGKFHSLSSPVYVFSARITKRLTRSLPLRTSGCGFDLTGTLGGPVGIVGDSFRALTQVKSLNPQVPQRYRGTRLRRRL